MSMFSFTGHTMYTCTITHNITHNLVSATILPPFCLICIMFSPPDLYMVSMRMGGIINECASLHVFVVSSKMYMCSHCVHTVFIFSDEETQDLSILIHFVQASEGVVLTKAVHGRKKNSTHCALSQDRVDTYFMYTVHYTVYSEININRVMDTVVHCNLVHVRTESNWINMYVFLYFPIGILMEIQLWAVSFKRWPITCP